MKQKVTTFMVLLSCTICHSQSNWSNWITVYSEGSKTIQISFKFSKFGHTCYPDGGGYHFYRLKNDFDEKVGGTILYDNTDCDGKNYTNSAPFHFQSSGIDEEMGMWFLGRGGVRNIKLRKAPDFYDRRNNGERTQNNNNNSTSDPKATVIGAEWMTTTKGPTNGSETNNKNPKASRAMDEPTDDPLKTSSVSEYNNQNATLKKESRNKEVSTGEQELAKERELANEKEIARLQKEARDRFVKDSTATTWKERNTRVDNFKQHQQEKLAATTVLTAGVAAFMLSENDNKKITGRKTFFKLGGFFGMANIPVYENMESSEQQYMNYTTTTSHFPMLFELELQGVLYRIKNLSFEISPFGQYGMTFSGGNDGYYFSYGARAMIKGGNRVKIYGTGSYEHKTGENTYDSDVAMESVGLTTNTKGIGSILYDYTLLSYGGGVIFETNSTADTEQEDKFIQLGAIIHKPSIPISMYQDVASSKGMLLGGQFKWVFGGGFTIAAEYIPNYTLAGDPTDRPSSIDEVGYWSAKIGKTINLSKSR